MGLIEEGGKLFNGIIDGLKEHPLILAFIILNLLYLVSFSFVLYEVATITSATNARRDGMLIDLFKSCIMRQ